MRALEPSIRATQTGKRTVTFVNLPVTIKCMRLSIPKFKLLRWLTSGVLKKSGGGSTRLVPSMATLPPRRVPQHCAQDLETAILFVRDEELREEVVEGAQQSRVLQSHCRWDNAANA